jgi:hypothetical protein
MGPNVDSLISGLSDAPSSDPLGGLVDSTPTPSEAAAEEALQAIQAAEQAAAEQVSPLAQTGESPWIPVGENVPAPGSVNPLGDTVPAPDPLGQTAPAPDPLGQTAPAPDPLGKTVPAPDPLGRTAPAPDPLGKTAPAPDPLDDTKPAP